MFQITFINQHLEVENLKACNYSANDLRAHSIAPILLTKIQ